MRRWMDNIIAENLVGKWLPFQFHNNELHCTEFLRAPMVIVFSLQRKLRNYLVHVKMDETSFNQEHTPLRVISCSKRSPSIVSCRSATTTLLTCESAQGTSLPYLQGEELHNRAIQRMSTRQPFQDDRQRME